MGVFGTVLVYLLMPCYYYRNEVEVMLELDSRTNRHKNCTKGNHHNHEHIPSFISLKFMLYDAKNFLRNLKLWPQNSCKTPDPLTSLKNKIDLANKNFFSLEQIL